MSSGEWQIPASGQPKPDDYEFDLDRALTAVVGVHATIPDDAFTAETLGTERAGNGVVIRAEGLVLTAGYLVTEAEQIWLHLADGRIVPGHVLGYDQETGFGLIQALEHVELPVLPIGRSGALKIGDPVVVGAAGGRTRSIAAKVVAKQEFAGYWEYVLDEAIFTAPSHPNWGGTALIDAKGQLVGIGSLQLQHARESGPPVNLNMAMPIDLLPPILEDLTRIGRPNRPPRPWLGLYATETDDHVVVAGLAGAGPAQDGDLRTGDVVLAVGDIEIETLAELYRSVWALGDAGVNVPLLIERDGETLELDIVSGDRSRFLKRPRLH